MLNLEGVAENTTSSLARDCELGYQHQCFYGRRGKLTLNSRQAADQKPLHQFDGKGHSLIPLCYEAWECLAFLASACPHTGVSDQ